MGKIHIYEVKEMAINMFFNFLNVAAQAFIILYMKYCYVDVTQ